MKKLLSLSLGMFMVLWISGCGPLATEKEGGNKQIKETFSEKDKVLVYMSGAESMIRMLEMAFEADHGDVMDISIMSCGHLRSKVWAESQAGDIQADVFWGSNPLIYNKLDKLGKLAPLHLKNIKDVKADYLLKDKNYQLVNERHIVIIYNDNKLNIDPPKSYADLMNNQYNNMLVKADASLSSTAFAIASSLYQITGKTDAFFKGLKANNILLTKANGLVSSVVMEGQAIIGISPLDAIIRLNKKGKKAGFEVPIKVVWPTEGTIAIPRPIAISASSSRSINKDKMAHKFVDFMLSKKAQNITEQFGMISVRKDINSKNRPNGSNIYAVDWASSVEHEDTIKHAYQEIFH